MEKQADFTDMAKAIADPLFQEYGKKNGLVWGGWDTNRNFADRLNDQQFQGEMTKAMGTAAGSDSEKLKQLLRGVHTLAGVEITPAMEQHLESLGDESEKYAPYLQRWMPETWDKLHGSAGSTAGLTRSIGEANRHMPGFSPEDAAGQAGSIRESLYGDNDPMKHRGYSMGEMGEIYQAALRRGLVSPNMDPKDVANILSQTSGVLSAGRDLMGGASIDDQFNLYDALPSGVSSQDLEQRLLRGGLAARQGGPFMAARAANGGGFTPGPGMASPTEMSAQHANLTSQAATSPIGNMAAATIRAGQEGLIQPDSPAGQLLTQIQNGQIPDMQTNQWIETLSRSGMDPGQASAILSQTGTNSKHMTPQLAEYVQAAQQRIDIQPEMAKIKAQYGPGMADQSIMRGEQGQVARNFGYRGVDHMNALHNTSQGVPAAMARVDQQADQMRAHSGIGQGNWLSRTSDAVRGATPNTSVGNIVAQGLGAVPTSQFRKGAGDFSKNVDSTLETAGNAISKAIGLAEPVKKIEDEKEKEKKKLETAVKRNTRERQARRIAATRAAGLPDAMAEKVAADVNLVPYDQVPAAVAARQAEKK